MEASFIIICVNDGVLNLTVTQDAWSTDPDTKIDCLWEIQSERSKIVDVVAALNRWSVRRFLQIKSTCRSEITDKKNNLFLNYF